MEKIQVQEQNGVYSCDIGISKEEWLRILQSKDVKQGFVEALLRFYYMPEHRGSCIAVSKRMGGNAYALNLYVSKFGLYVQKRLNRFEVYGTDGKPTRWVIPMCKGRILAKSEDGSFEWELRPELSDAIKEYLYGFLIERYKDLRRSISIRDRKLKRDELYKWELITACEGKTPLQIVCDHVKSPNKATEGGFENLIDAIRDNKALKYILEKSPEELNAVLHRLVDESQPLNERLADFKTSMAKLLPSSDFRSKANDERTAATILTCYSPDRYTFYKHDELYDRLCKYLGEDMRRAGECYEHYLSLLMPLAQLANSDEDLQELIQPMLKGQRQSCLLLAQDILWMLLKSCPKRFDFIYKLLFNTDNMENNNKSIYRQLLEANYNLILTGAPGTGKTYLAKQIAAEMLGLDDVDLLESNSNFGFVQFHPSYDYTDFVEGLRPMTGNNGETGFQRQDGLFKDFCKRAFNAIRNDDTAASASTNFVFIIDEINRGEISKIFGELFFSIDPGYRGETGRVQTQYQNMIDKGDVFKDGFYIPKNVYIIGTMNDIDRSVESMDFAMRRRFAWKEVTAEESMKMLEGMPDEERLKNRMRNLNNAIVKVRGLGKAYQIGAAYFKKIEKYDGDFEQLWHYHLEGLLYEYLRGNNDAGKQLKELKQAYDNEAVKHEADDTY